VPFIYNDNHRDFAQRWKTPGEKGGKGVAHELLIPADGVGWCSDEDADWVLPKFSFLSTCTKAEAEVHCARRGREVPVAGAEAEPKPEGGSQ